jgi:hypothetical protein
MTTTQITIKPNSSAASALRPLVFDLGVPPGWSGLDAAADLRGKLPSCKVLILTTFGRPGYLRRARNPAGADSPSRTAWLRN